MIQRLLLNRFVMVRSSPSLSGPSPKTPKKRKKEKTKRKTPIRRLLLHWVRCTSRATKTPRNSSTWTPSTLPRRALLLFFFSPFFLSLGSHHFLSPHSLEIRARDAIEAQGESWFPFFFPFPSNRTFTNWETHWKSIEEDLYLLFLFLWFFFPFS